LSPAFRAYEFLKILEPRYLIRNLRYVGVDEVNGIPIPPQRLIVSVSGISDITLFLKEGELATQSILETLSKNEIRIKDFSTILDFGCGCGRVMRHWTDLINTTVFGTDMNPKMIAWCKQNIPFAQFDTNDSVPPLSYSDHKFNFIYALSVFSHLSEPMQFAWMDELHRALQENGFLLFTVRGQRYFSRLDPDEKEKFRNEKIVVRNPDHSGTNMCNAYHSEEFVRHKLTLKFKVIDYVPEGAIGNPYQDIVLVQKTRTG
jgi:SAM-dependent methyltransferase